MHLSIQSKKVVINNLRLLTLIDYNAIIQAYSIIDDLRPTFFGPYEGYLYSFNLTVLCTVTNCYGMNICRLATRPRSIADMKEPENILPEHLAEAIQYRSLNRENWAE